MNILKMENLSEIVESMMGVDWRLRGLQFWTSKRNAIKTK